MSQHWHLFVMSRDGDGFSYLPFDTVLPYVLVRSVLIVAVPSPLLMHLRTRETLE